MLSLLVWSLVIVIVINILMFVVAFKQQSDKLTDISYAVSFFGLGLFLLIEAKQFSYFSLIGFLMIAVWAIRIGSFLLYRVLKVGFDRRFDDIRNNFWRFGKFWVAQALTAWVLLLPYALSVRRHHQFYGLSLIGLFIWLIGLAVEAIADIQKYRFHNLLVNKNKWIDSGIWHYSRHPNYFGEIAVWLGLYLYLEPNLNLVEKLIGLVSPVFISILLLFISGVPPLEKAADARWGKDKAYQTYKKTTSLIVPFPKKASPL